MAIPDVNKNDVIQGAASWAEMTSPRGKLTVVAFHPTKKVNKAEELTYLSTKIGYAQVYWNTSIKLYYNWQSLL